MKREKMATSDEALVALLSALVLFGLVVAFSVAKALTPIFDLSALLR